MTSRLAWWTLILALGGCYSTGTYRVRGADWASWQAHQAAGERMEAVPAVTEGGRTVLLRADDEVTAVTDGDPVMVRAKRYDGLRTVALASSSLGVVFAAVGSALLVTNAEAQRCGGPGTKPPTCGRAVYEPAIVPGAMVGLGGGLLLAAGISELVAVLRAPPQEVRYERRAERSRVRLAVVPTLGEARRLAP